MKWNACCDWCQTRTGQVAALRRDSRFIFWTALFHQLVCIVGVPSSYSPRTTLAQPLSALACQPVLSSVVNVQQHMQAAAHSWKHITYFTLRDFMESRIVRGKNWRRGWSQHKRVKKSSTWKMPWKSIHILRSFKDAVTLQQPSIGLFIGDKCNVSMA